MRTAILPKTAMTILLVVFLSGGIFAGEATVKSDDGLTISYEVLGSGEPALVFVHGWCCDRSYWKDQVSHFSKDHTVVAIDLGGHGKSGLERENWSIEAFGADVAAVVRALDLKNVILIGHSMGGPVAALASPLLQGRVTGIIGVDTFKNLGTKFAEEQINYFLQQFRSDFKSFTRNFVGSMFPAGADTTLVKSVADDMASAPPEVGIGAMESMLRLDARKAFGAVTVPVAAVNTDRPPTDVEAGKQLFKSFEVKVMTGYGHFLMLEYPAAFNALLEEAVEGMTAGK